MKGEETVGSEGVELSPVIAGDDARSEGGRVDCVDSLRLFLGGGGSSMSVSVTLSRTDPSRDNE